MKKMLFVFLVAILSSGCVVTQYKPITLKKIGVIVPDNKNSKLCHLYTGVTAFNNEFNEYDFTKKFDGIFHESIEIGIKSQGNILINAINLTKEQVEENFTRSKWDHSLSVTEAGSNLILNNWSNYDVDYVIIPWAMDDPLLCTGQYKNYVNNSGNASIALRYQLHIISTSDFSDQSRIFVGNYNNFVIPFNPVNPIKLSSVEIEKLQDSLSKAITADVKNLLGKQ